MSGEICKDTLDQKICLNLPTSICQIEFILRKQFLSDYWNDCSRVSNLFQSSYCVQKYRSNKCLFDGKQISVSFSKFCRIFFIHTYSYLKQILKCVQFSRKVVRNFLGPFHNLNDKFLSYKDVLKSHASEWIYFLEIATNVLIR